jgi:hypothetical protein
MATSAISPAVTQAQFVCTTNNGNIAIKFYTGSADAVTFPDSLDGLPVTCIGDYTFCPNFCHSSNLTCVTIGNNVTNIGKSAFDFCYRLSAITVDPLNTCGWDKTFGGRPAVAVTDFPLH